MSDELKDVKDELDLILRDAKKALRETPDRPSETCPLIDTFRDKLQETVNTFVEELEHAWEIHASLDTELDKFVYPELEKIRAANKALRENGTHLYKAFRELIEDVAKLRSSL